MSDVKKLCLCAFFDLLCDVVWLCIFAVCVFVCVMFVSGMFSVCVLFVIGCGVLYG